LRKQISDREASIKTMNLKMTELQEQNNKKDYEIIRPLNEAVARLEMELRNKDTELLEQREVSERQSKQSSPERGDKNEVELVNLRKEKERIKSESIELQNEFEHLQQEYMRNRNELSAVRRQLNETFNCES